jgi:hypothetical protein
MRDPLSFTEIDSQHLELLPARTVMSMFMAATKGEAAAGSNTGTGGTDGTATQAASPLSSLMDGLPLGKLLGK